MKARNLRELYQEHRTKYSTFKQNSDLHRQLFDTYLESKQGYIMSISHLMKDYGAFAGFMGIQPLNQESLSTIENAILHVSEKIRQGKYDAFDSKPFDRLGAIKKDIEEFSNNLALMQLFIDSQTKNPELYQEIMQYIFAVHLSMPNISIPGHPTSQDLIDLIEEKVRAFEVNKVALQQKVEELRVQCQKLGECLLIRKIKRDQTEQFRQAVYHEQVKGETLQLSVAPNATQFGGSNTRQQESIITPSLSPNLSE